MKGKLCKKDNEWLVFHGKKLYFQLHPDDAEAIEELYKEGIFNSPKNDEIEFQIVDIPLEPAGNNIWVSRFAKIVWE